MSGAGKFAWQSARRDADVPCWRRRVAAPSDEARLATADDRPDRSDVAIADRRECVALRAPVRCVDQDDVGRPAGAQQAAIEAIDAGVAAGGGSDGGLGWHTGET